MYGIVWYQHREEGKKQLQKITDNYLNKNINYNKITQFPTSVIFENGDTWKLLPANDNSLGHRCNISFVEKCIPLDTFNTLICPVTTALPYGSYNFYGEGELDIWNINS